MSRLKRIPHIDQLVCDLPLAYPAERCQQGIRLWFIGVALQVTDGFDCRLLLILAQEAQRYSQEQVIREPNVLQQLQSVGYLLDVRDCGIARAGFELMHGIGAGIIVAWVCEVAIGRQVFLGMDQLAQMHFDWLW